MQHARLAGRARGAAYSGANVIKVNVNPFIVGAGIGYRFGVADFAPVVVAKY